MVPRIFLVVQTAVVVAVGCTEAYPGMQPGEVKAKIMQVREVTTKSVQVGEVKTKSMQLGEVKAKRFQLGEVKAERMQAGVRAGGGTCRGTAQRSCQKWCWLLQGLRA
jgi:hypothetical protein